MTEQARKNMSIAGLGKKKSEQGRLNIRNGIRKRFEGHKSVLPEYERIRASFEYREWMKAVISRDNCTCQDCGAKPGSLDAHHIYPFSMLVQEFLMGIRTEQEIHSIENGITLCRTCHKARHSNGFTPVEIRMLRSIKKLWNSRPSTMPFKDFYETQMEKIIDHIKTKLP